MSPRSMRGPFPTEREGCMNAAPRLMTLSAQRLSGKTEIYYGGTRTSLPDAADELGNADSICGEERSRSSTERPWRKAHSTPRTIAILSSNRSSTTTPSGHYRRVHRTLCELRTLGVANKGFGSTLLVRSGRPYAVLEGLARWRCTHPRSCSVLSDERLRLEGLSTGSEWDQPLARVVASNWPRISDPNLLTALTSWGGFAHAPPSYSLAAVPRSDPSEIMRPLAGVLRLTAATGVPLSAERAAKHLSGDLWDSFPQSARRILIDKVATLLEAAGSKFEGDAKWDHAAKELKIETVSSPSGSKATDQQVYMSQAPAPWMSGQATRQTRRTRKGRTTIRMRLLMIDLLA